MREDTETPKKDGRNSRGKPTLLLAARFWLCANLEPDLAAHGHDAVNIRIDQVSDLGLMFFGVTRVFFVNRATR